MWSLWQRSPRMAKCALQRFTGPLPFPEGAPCVSTSLGPGHPQWLVLLLFSRGLWPVAATVH